MYGIWSCCSQEQCLYTKNEVIFIACDLWTQVELNMAKWELYSKPQLVLTFDVSSYWQDLLSNVLLSTSQAFERAWYWCIVEAASARWKCWAGSGNIRSSSEWSRDWQPGNSTKCQQKVSTYTTTWIGMQKPVVWSTFMYRLLLYIAFYQIHPSFVAWKV